MIIFTLVGALALVAWVLKTLLRAADLRVLALVVAFLTLRVCRFVQSHPIRQYMWAACVDLLILGALTLALPDLAVLRLLVLGLSLLLGIFSSEIFWRVRGIIRATKPLPRRYPCSGLGAALRIQRSTFPGTLPTWAYLSAAARGRVYVRCADGTSVAVAVVERLPGINWLSYLAVDSDQRRQGHARALLSELGPLSLTVCEDKEEAVKLYLSVGFICAARWPNYYGRGQAGLLMVSRS